MRILRDSQEGMQMHAYRKYSGQCTHSVHLTVTNDCQNSMPTLLYFSTMITALGLYCVVEVLSPVFKPSVDCLEVGFIVWLGVCVCVCVCVCMCASKCTRACTLDHAFGSLAYFSVPALYSALQHLWRFTFLLSLFPSTVLSNQSAVRSATEAPPDRYETHW